MFLPATTFDEAIEPLRPGLLPVPAAGQPGVCSICRSSAEHDAGRCAQCRQAAWASPPEVLPICLALHGQVVHHHLWQYKDCPSAARRAQATARLAALVREFLTRHSVCVGGWDLLTCVPSPRRVALEAVVAQLGPRSASYRRVLAARPSSFGRFVDPSQFAVAGSVRERRVLLLDDTLVSGARLFSAAAALREAGAEVVGPVVIARHLQASWPPSARLLSWLGWRPWRADRCARCAGERQDEPPPDCAPGPALSLGD